MNIPNATTREDKLKLVNNLQKTFHHKNELLLPDSELYPMSFDNDSLTRAGKKICVWLGVKPHNLKFEINDSETVGYHSKDGTNIITIDSKLSASPFVASAVVAKSCISYFFNRKRVEYDTELLELASVELGLGLLFVNSFNSSGELGSKIKRTLTIRRHPYVSDSVLSHFSPQEYARLVENYIGKNQLGYRSVTEHMLPWAVPYLHLRDKNIKILRPTDYSRRVQKDLSALRIKAALLAVLLVSSLALGTFLWQNQPKKLSTILQSQKEDIEVLEKSYKACMDSARYKQEKYDDKDLFLIRQLDAHILRCTSIRNSHDYMVKQYNNELTEAGF